MLSTYAPPIGLPLGHSVTLDQRQLNRTPTRRTRGDSHGRDHEELREELASTGDTRSDHYLFFLRELVEKGDALLIIKKLKQTEKLLLSKGDELQAGAGGDEIRIDRFLKVA